MKIKGRKQQIFIDDEKLSLGKEKQEQQIVKEILKMGTGKLDCGAALNKVDDGVLSGGGYVIFLVDEWSRLAFMWIGTRISRVGSSLVVDCVEAMIMDVEAEEMGLVVVEDKNGLVKTLTNVVKER